MDNEIERDYQEEQWQREYHEQEQREEAAYFARLEAGMCPHCESMKTAREEILYSAVATRYCSDCGTSYVAEW